jgi:2',3'-cyclic-nucleotide 2'-phosphodiesterase (5'-nucleotidase family)
MVLTLRDAGDHHDGSGLVSSSRTSAAQADEIFQMLHYDIMTIGNHELYSYDTARVVYDQAKALSVHSTSTQLFGSHSTYGHSVSDQLMK